MGRIDFNNAVNQNYVLRESPVSNYYRKFNLSDSVQIEKIEAELADGQLKVTLPKHERVKPRVIKIK
jgi:HSP20 family molecular chaperone IbpA